MAASFGHKAVVRKLLGYSEVDIAIQDVNGATALT
jgi:ankyrin repeat protein